MKDKWTIGILCAFLIVGDMVYSKPADSTTVTQLNDFSPHKVGHPKNPKTDQGQGTR